MTNRGARALDRHTLSEIDALRLSELDKALPAEANGEGWGYIQVGVGGSVRLEIDGDGDGGSGRARREPEAGATEGKDHEARLHLDIVRVFLNLPEVQHPTDHHYLFPSKGK